MTETMKKSSNPFRMVLLIQFISVWVHLTFRRCGPSFSLKNIQEKKRKLNLNQNIGLNFTQSSERYIQIQSHRWMSSIPMQEYWNLQIIAVEILLPMDIEIEYYGSIQLSMSYVGLVRV